MDAPKSTRGKRRRNYIQPALRKPAASQAISPQRITRHYSPDGPLRGAPQATRTLSSPSAGTTRGIVRILNRSCRTQPCTCISEIRDWVSVIQNWTELRSTTVLLSLRRRVVGGSKLRLQASSSHPKKKRAAFGSAVVADDDGMRPAARAATFKSRWWQCRQNKPGESVCTGRRKICSDSMAGLGRLPCVLNGTEPRSFGFRYGVASHFWGRWVH